MWYFAIYLGRAALKEPESNGSQIRILINKTLESVVKKNLIGDIFFIKGDLQGPIYI